METFVASRGGNLWSISEGQGVSILVLNGGPGCCDYLQPVADMLTGQAQVIRFEPSGCGRSDYTPPYDIDACLKDIENVRAHYGVNRWIVVGHSWGADLAVMYALQFPGCVLGFICLSGGRFHNDREWHRLYDERRELEVPPKFEYPPNMDVNRQGNASWKQYIQQPTLWRDLSRLNRPGLLLYGEQDIRPSWPVEQVAALLPNAEFHMIEKADHLLWTSQAEQVKVRIQDFVRQVERA